MVVIPKLNILKHNVGGVSPDETFTFVDDCYILVVREELLSY